jgi:hypothetical protein
MQSVPTRGHAEASHRTLSQHGQSPEKAFVAGAGAHSKVAMQTNFATLVIGTQWYSTPQLLNQHAAEQLMYLPSQLHQHQSKSIRRS